MDFTFNGIGNTSTQDIHIINKSNTDLDAVLTITGTDSTGFAISSSNPIKVLQNEDHLAKISFLAQTTNDMSANLKIFFSEVNYELNIPLTATYINSIYEPAKKISVNIYPNPSSKGIVFDFDQLTNSNIEIELYNENGVLIRRLGANELNGNQIDWNLLDIQGKAVASGVYNAVIYIDKMIIKKSVVLSK
jgi:hypothetical protein